MRDFTSYANLVSAKATADADVSAFFATGLSKTRRILLLS